MRALNEFPKEQLVSMLVKQAEKSKAVRGEMINFIDENAGRFREIGKKTINEAKYNELWGESHKIISDFNEYGGGPDEDEEVVYQNFDEIAKLFNGGKLDWDTKKEFIEGCLKQYFLGNSGFDDLLTDTIFDICAEKKDWLFVLKKLKGHPNDSTHHLIMRIYRDKLGDDENYIKERTADLKYGLDYHELASFYEQKGNHEKAFETVEKGIAKGEGRMTELIEFMAKHYKDHNDHQNALKFLAMQFEDEPALKNYIAVKKYAEPGEWQVLSKKMHAFIRDKPGKKAEIDYYLKDYESVLKYVVNYDPLGFDFPYEIHGWAKKLEQHFPQQILNKYKQAVHAFISTKKVKNYGEAKRYILEIKRMLLKGKKEKEWNLYSRSIRNQYQNLPALLRELGGL